MAKRSSDPRIAYPEVKLQVRDPVRVVGIVAPFASLGVGTRRQFVLSSPREKMGIGDLCRMPPAALHTGRATQTSGTGPCGDYRRVPWYRACGVSIRGKLVLSRNMGYKTRGVAMLLNVVLTPGKPTPKSNFRGGT